MEKVIRDVVTQQHMMDNAVQALVEKTAHDAANEVAREMLEETVDKTVLQAAKDGAQTAGVVLTTYAVVLSGIYVAMSGFTWGWDKAEEHIAARKVRKAGVISV